MRLTRPSYEVRWDRAVERATVAAAEYRRLNDAGRYPEADQVATTIDTLVGTWRVAGFGVLHFVWPETIAAIADVHFVRRVKA